MHRNALIIVISYIYQGRSNICEGGLTYSRIYFHLIFFVINTLIPYGFKRPLLWTEESNYSQNKTGGMSSCYWYIFYHIIDHKLYFCINVRCLFLLCGNWLYVSNYLNHLYIMWFILLRSCASGVINTSLQDFSHPLKKYMLSATPKLQSAFR